jgi:hypothetical protein
MLSTYIFISVRSTLLSGQHGTSICLGNEISKENIICMHTHWLISTNKKPIWLLSLNYGHLSQSLHLCLHKNQGLLKAIFKTKGKSVPKAWAETSICWPNLTSLCIPVCGPNKVGKLCSKLQQPSHHHIRQKLLHINRLVELFIALRIKEWIT